MKKTLLAALAAALALPAAAADAALDLSAATFGGAFDGDGVRRESGGLAVVEVSGKTEVRGERWRLEVPFRLAHKETFGADLVETTGALSVEPWWEATSRVRLGLEAGGFGADRPDWADLYQRDPVTSELRPTDRYGYLAWRVGGQLYARPAPHQHLRARYRYVAYDYVEDPEFDATPNPISGEPDLMHLTPRDRAEHQLDASWRYRQKTWALGVSLDTTRRAYDTLLARNRRSGATPEDGLGNELNPRQELAIWEPAVELELVRLGGKLELSLGYGLDVHDDPFQGYYSLKAHNPRVKAKLAVTDRLGAELSADGWYATYGDDGSSRLEGNDTRRKDSRTRARGELEYRLGGGLSMQLAAEVVVRATNYADYEPDPITNEGYDVAFDYTNVTALGGIRYRL